jgi:hypothetical protein
MSLSHSLHIQLFDVDEIKTTFNNINNFNQNLKDFLCTNSFYMLNEFLLRDKHCKNA